MREMTKEEEEENDRNFRRTMELIEEHFRKNKRPSLQAQLLQWYHSRDPVQSDSEAVSQILNIVEEWLPIEDRRNYIGDPWNNCVRSMKERLRDG